MNIGPWRKVPAKVWTPKDGQCEWSTMRLRLSRQDVMDGAYKCQCGAVVKLRVLAPGMNGEKRVSSRLPVHKPGVTQ